VPKIFLSEQLFRIQTIVHNDDLSVSLSNKSRLLEPDEVFARFVPYQNASYPEPTKSRDRYIKGENSTMFDSLSCLMGL